MTDTPQKRADRKRRLEVAAAMREAMGLKPLAALETGKAA